MNSSRDENDQRDKILASHTTNSEDVACRMTVSLIVSYQTATYVDNVSFRRLLGLDPYRGLDGGFKVDAPVLLFAQILISQLSARQETLCLVQVTIHKLMLKNSCAMSDLPRVCSLFEFLDGIVVVPNKGGILSPGSTLCTYVRVYS